MGIHVLEIIINVFRSEGMCAWDGCAMSVAMARLETFHGIERVHGVCHIFGVSVFGPLV